MSILRYTDIETNTERKRSNYRDICKEKYNYNYSDEYKYRHKYMDSITDLVKVGSGGEEASSESVLSDSSFDERGGGRRIIMIIIIITIMIIMIITIMIRWRQKNGKQDCRIVVWSLFGSQ